jgi:hypothetical protein
VRELVDIVAGHGIGQDPLVHELEDDLDIGIILQMQGARGVCEHEHLAIAGGEVTLGIRRHFGLQRIGEFLKLLTGHRLHTVTCRRDAADRLAAALQGDDRLVQSYGRWIRCHPYAAGGHCGSRLLGLIGTGRRARERPRSLWMSRGE